MPSVPGSTGPQSPASLASPASGAPPQRKVLSVLVGGQILGGIGMGATLSLGSLLAAQLSGSPAWSGMAATMSTLGAAVAAVPLARLAGARGRRISLSTGALIAGTGAAIAITSAWVSVFPLLLLGLMLLGAGSAVNLQARFAATDLARSGTRARDLSVVVWSTTIGAVLGPNLFGPGEVVGAALGFPPLTGAFAFSVAAQLAAALVYLTGLRPDPLLTAMSLRDTSVKAPRPQSGTLVLRSNAGARYAVAAVALSHATMVSLMSMTPVHLREHGASLVIVGFTISLHIAGMYALSPVFGWLADKVGRVRVIVLGQGMLLASLVIAGFAADSRTGVTVSLVLLGLGWSAAVVAGSAMVAESVPIQDRPAIQGISDLSMNAAGAIGGALAGPVLASMGYSGLAFLAMALVGAVLIWTALHARRSMTPPNPVHP
ncbi:MFS transporter [Pseudarthrobacter sp. H3Y2-7]|uniref:MFS transporter n=1 Tax=Pseudarthrobacter naphthalenicus TaxID=3031328 RepID=UPI0023B1E2F9|nr:MFS transporter [Pseudarthrobacter sp. H3Y2-7]MDE8670256.1 MFS transporter [Pseudarthrobacter sp. H3Y2-7]